MKNIYLRHVILLLTVLIAACTKKEPEVLDPHGGQKDDRTYTIMMYGCGGGNLDRAIILNIQEALLTGSSEKVKFTGQVKFSERFQNTEEFKGTQRFVVEPTNGTWYSPKEILDTDLELHKPENLTDFINWSKEQCPADDYILLLSNHGSGWTPEYDYPDTRAICHDDNLDDRAMTLDELVKGIKDSGTKMKMIYYDACMMGMLEVMTGICDCAEYALSSSHVTPDMGGDYSSLIYNLNHSEDFEHAITSLCQETMSHWDSQDMAFDLTFVDLSKMNKLLEEIKVLSGYMKDAAEITAKYSDDNINEDDSNLYYNDQKIAQTFTNALNKAYHYIWIDNSDNVSLYPFYDIMTLVENLANGPINSYSAKFIDIAGRINRAMADAIICKRLTSNIQRYNFTLGVTIVSRDVWTKYKYDTTYNTLKFDQLTNWGKWLGINPISPKDNPNPLTILGKTDFEDEDEDIPLEQEIESMLQLIGKR